MIPPKSRVLLPHRRYPRPARLRRNCADFSASSAAIR